MALSSRIGEIRAQLANRNRDLVELEIEAGIAEDAERLRGERASYDLICEAAEGSHQASINRNLRKLYFSVRDLELRRDLIEADREIAQSVRQYWQQNLFDAADRQKAARLSSKFWWIWAGMCGAILIGAGFHFFGLVGALAGLLVGYLWSRQIEHRALEDRKRAIADADRQYQGADQTFKEVRSERQKFSPREAETGEPDPFC